MTLRDRSRSLRREATPAERALWRALKGQRFRSWHFRRQHPIPPYFADFASIRGRLVVEIDGSQHAESLRDRARDTYLVEQGWRVLRFWNEEVAESIDGVCDGIERALAGR